MATNEFLTLDGGEQSLVTGAASSTGVAEANQLVSTNGSGVIDPSLLPPGVGLQAQVKIPTEDLAAGDYVSLVGSGNCSLANGSVQTLPAEGFVLVGVTAPTPVTVFFSGLNSSDTNAVEGAKSWLSTTTPGKSTTTPPTPVNGQILQFLGVGTDTNTLNFEKNDKYLINI